MPKSIHLPEYQLLVQLLRETREKAGLTQVELSERLGRPQSFVAKIEAGERRLDVVELREVCAALGTSLEKFVRRFERACKGAGV